MLKRPLTRIAIRMGAAASVAALVAGCATNPPIVAAPAGPAPVLINPDYKAGQVDIPEQPLPSLEDVINRVPSRAREPKDQEDRLRSPAMKDAAMSYGAKAGLAWESRNINRMIQSRADEISRVFDFNRVMIKGPDNVTILPPVISQANEAYETSEAGKTLRVADTVFEIVEQARFSPVAPLWQAYLLRDYKTPEPPPDILLPRDGEEKDHWKRWVVEGWNLGREQAQQIFQADQERLERDFLGMVRYKALLEEGKVSAPVVADARLGTTGTGQDMRVNDRAIRITADPKLQVRNPQEWQASPTTPGPDAKPTGSDPSKPRVNRRPPAGETAASPVRREAPSRKAWGNSF